MELALGITDGVMIYSSRANQGAIIEWILAFIFFFFAISFGADFHPTNVAYRRFTPKPSMTQPIITQQCQYPIGSAQAVTALKMVVKDAQYFPATSGSPSFEVRVTFCLAEDSH